MAVAAFALAIENIQADTINNTVVAPFDRSDMATVNDAYQERDFTALARLCANGKALLLKAGTTVTVLDAPFMSGLEKVRPRGSSESVWVPYEFVNH